MIAELISEVCPEVSIVPHLEPVFVETFRSKSTSTDDQARVDIRARGFWGGHYGVAFLTCAFLTRLPPQIALAPWPPATVAMKEPRYVCTRKEFEKWTMERLHLWSQQEEEPVG